MKDLEDVTVEVFELIDEYNNGINSSIDVHRVIILRDRLAIQSVYLAEHTGEAIKHHLKCEFDYKIKLAKETDFYLDKFSHAASKEKSIIATRNEKEKEIIWEGTHKKLRLILNQVNAVLDAMQQRISQLKREQPTPGQ